MNHYLLKFNRITGQLEHREFKGVNGRERALTARFNAERYSRNTDIEIVVIGAQSWDDVKKNHARYFSGGESEGDDQRPVHL